MLTEKIRETLDPMVKMLNNAADETKRQYDELSDSPEDAEARIYLTVLNHAYVNAATAILNEELMHTERMMATCMKVIMDKMEEEGES